MKKSELIKLKKELLREIERRKRRHNWDIRDIVKFINFY